MESLSPTALRMIGRALAQNGDQRRQAAWDLWASDPARDMPSSLAQIAIHALSGMALRIEERVVDPATPSLEASQLENDLGYIVDLEETLLGYLNPRIPAYS